MMDEIISTQNVITAFDDATPRRSDEGTPLKDSVVRIVSTKPSRPEYATPQTPMRRDWASAIELVNEACEAIRIAEEKASAAEHYSEELNQYHTEQAKMAAAKISTLEKRLESAESRANEAEEWLLRFHDAIVEGFTGVLKVK
jgi:hypothetical protein